MTRGGVSALAGSLAPTLGAKAVRQLKGLLDSYNQMSINSNTPNINGGTTSGRSQKRRKRGKKQGPTSSSEYKLMMPVVRGVGQLPMTTTFTDYLDISNLTAGNTSFGVDLSVSALPVGGGASYLGSVVPRLATVATAYREFKILSVAFSYFSQVNDQTSGYLAMGVDPQVSAGTPTGRGAVVRHPVAVMGDIKDRYTMAYRPSIDGKVSPKYISPSAGVTSSDELSYGTFQVYSANSGAAAALMGTIQFVVTVQFMGST